MKIDNVTSAIRKDDRSIELTVTDPLDGTTSKKRYATIRGGISWPTARAPAYFCLVAQETFDKGRRVLLAEYESESLSLSGFYSRITDIADQMFCQDFYAEMPEDRLDCGFLNDFDDFARERKSNVFLWDAPDPDNFVLGLSRIKDNIDKRQLVISDNSIVYNQLRSFTRPDLEAKPEEIFFAINGLRHVVGSYSRDPPTNRQSCEQQPAGNWRVM